MKAYYHYPDILRRRSLQGSEITLPLKRNLDSITIRAIKDSSRPEFLSLYTTKRRTIWWMVKTSFNMYPPLCRSNTEKCHCNNMCCSLPCLKAEVPYFQVWPQTHSTIKALPAKTWYQRAGTPNWIWSPDFRQRTHMHIHNQAANR